MANRAMLFAANAIPDGATELALVGLTEFNYHIPTIYQLLVSSSPTLCRSCIFGSDELLAIAGDAVVGLETLCKVRDELPDNAAGLPSINEAIDFLSEEQHKYPYFLLEPAEVFHTLGKPLPPQMNRLLEKISTLDSNNMIQLAKKNPFPKHWASGCWSNVLYYQPAGTVQTPPRSRKSSTPTAPSTQKPTAPISNKPIDHEPLQRSSLSGFEACVELVNRVFGEDARKLSRDGYQLEISFFLNVLEIRSIEAVAEGSTYEFESTATHKELRSLMSEALAKIVREQSVHQLIFNLTKSDEWAFKVVVNKDQIVADQYAISVLDLTEQRIDWFKDFIQSDEVLEFNFHSSSMPRHYGPLWPAYRFGYLLGHSQDSLWIMSHGLSNPVFHTDDPKWKQSNGFGCEVLVRCDTKKLDLTAPAKNLLESSEIITMVALCNTLINATKNGELNRASKAQTVQLEYYKPTLSKPIKQGTKFLMTNASLYKLCEKIPCLGRAKALPLVASAVPKNLESKKSAAIAQALIDDGTLGFLPKLKG